VFKKEKPTAFANNSELSKIQRLSKPQAHADITEKIKNMTKKYSSISFAEIIPRIEALSKITESSDGLTRRCFTSQHKEANDLVGKWMRSAGMRVRQDEAGNIIGRYEGLMQGAPALMIGSHLDTVVRAGKYDGMLGVVTAIQCVDTLFKRGVRKHFAIEVIGFTDEEGVRFQSTYLGSRAIANTFQNEFLEVRDEDGITMRDAMRDFGLDPSKIPKAARSVDDLVGYLEVHIEQGPVLESKKVAVGVVTAIAGATRQAVRITGAQGHAGTVPMALRQDALMAAAECTLAVESVASKKKNVVGTVGRIAASPGAINVIPAEVTFTIDLRADKDVKREDAIKELNEIMSKVAAKREVKVDIKTIHEAPGITCAPWIVTQIGNALEAELGHVVHLPSGAGHDAVAMADLTDVGMIFVRCRGGISHNPKEFIQEEDAKACAHVLLKVVENFQVNR
jgi:allantoate deiminase